MSTARKTLYATIGAGEKALERTRSLSSRLAELPTQLRPGSIKELPKAAASLRTEGTKRVTSIVKSGRTRTDKLVRNGGELVKTSRTRTEELLTQARKQATREFDDLAKRGEKLIGSIRRSQKTKDATQKAKTAKTRVKTASKAVADAASAAAEAAGVVVDRVETQTDPSEATA
jgi:hypothetical protein